MSFLLEEWNIPHNLANPIYPAVSDDTIFFPAPVFPRVQVVGFDASSDTFTAWDVPLGGWSVASHQSLIYVSVTSGVLQINPANHQYLVWDLAPILGSTTYPTNFVFDSHGHVWFGLSGTTNMNWIGRLEPFRNELTLWPVPFTYPDHLLGIQIDSNGNIFFVIENNSIGRVGRLNPASPGTYEFWPLATGYYPTLQVSPSGDLFFLSEAYVGQTLKYWLTQVRPHANTTNNWKVPSASTSTSAFSSFAVKPSGAVCVYDRQPNSILEFVPASAPVSPLLPSYVSVPVPVVAIQAPTTGMATKTSIQVKKTISHLLPGKPLGIFSTLPLPANIGGWIWANSHGQLLIFNQSKIGRLT